ncbi:hypothetical protein C3B51_19275 [Pseudoalteromonas rubra]|uniref:Uncharacterized protein n=1 Tax=Pseudoalteromonas rubra TaxID=43658 RepID=A0A4Q7E0P5_9GAMM|nr:hypothetical protein [Pseudoalteromonas rubra]RZM74926.1 hypothetical protein C3B51_19275 [Pseudoalteromonas rubra]
MKNKDMSVELNTKTFLFELNPKSNEEAWELKYFDADCGKYKKVASNEPLDIPFVLDKLEGISDKAYRALISRQQAVIIVEMKDKKHADWRFWQNGISLTSEQDEQDYTLNAQVQNQGKTLVLTINNVLSNAALCEGEFDRIDFRFVAVKLNESAGQLNEIFYSQDPRVGVRRNKPA